MNEKPFATSVLMTKPHAVDSGFNFQMVLRLFMAVSQDEARGLAVRNAMKLHPTHDLSAVLECSVYLDTAE